MKFEIGDRVYNKARGVGIVKKLDEDDKEFSVLVKFKGKCNIAWLPEKSLHIAKEAE